MKKRTLIWILFSTAVLSTGYFTIPPLVEKWLQPPPEEQGTYLQGAGIFKDSVSQTLFYVESDGRHVSAIDRHGRLQWHRDPFVDGKFEPYRTLHPVIRWIGPALDIHVDGRKGKWIGIAFDSSQFGIINVATGEFIGLGQD